MRKLAEVYQKGKLHRVSDWEGTELLIFDSVLLFFETDTQSGFTFLGKSFTDLKKIVPYFENAKRVRLVGGGDLSCTSQERRQFFSEVKKLLVEKELEVDRKQFLTNKIYRVKLASSLQIEEVPVTKNDFLTVVDDSRTFLKLVKSELYQNQHDLDMIASLSPFDAIELSSHPKNSLLITDINMPEINGLKLTKILNDRLPVLMMSGEVSSDSPDVISALEGGRVDFVIKKDVKDPSTQEKINALRSSKALKAETQSHTKIQKLRSVKNLDAMFIGTSTGGVQTLEFILKELGPLPFPIFVMIHMPGQFTSEFARRLNKTYRFFDVIHVDKDLQMDQKAVYLGHGDMHFKLFEGENGFKIRCVQRERVKGFCPNIDFAFQSLAKNRCKRVAAGVLTGMGRDGAQGLLEVKKSGGFTYSQDEESCIVFGMPKAVQELNAQQVVLSPKQIARWFNECG